MSVSLQSAQVQTAKTLREAGIDTAQLDARVLLKVATGLSLEALISNGRETLSEQSAERLRGFLARRLAGEPVSRIRGTREFYGRDFKIDRSTLDPRPDTETLIETVLTLIKRENRTEQPLRILDLGTGSGCILVTLLAELPKAFGFGVDISPGALRVAEENARVCGVGGRASFIASDWFENVEGSFDIVVSNPPYIARAEINQLAPEVAEHDPRSALDGGVDGLDAYRAIAREARDFLAPEGVLIVEIGCTQALSVATLFLEHGFTVAKDGIIADLGGNHRCMCAKISQV